MLLNIENQINTNQIIIGNLNAPLQRDRWTKEKTNKDLSELKHTFEHMDLIDTCRAFYPTTIQYTFFSSAPEHVIQNRSYTSP